MTRTKPHKLQHRLLPRKRRGQNSFCIELAVIYIPCCVVLEFSIKEYDTTIVYVKVGQVHLFIAHKLATAMVARYLTCNQSPMSYEEDSTTTS